MGATAVALAVLATALGAEKPYTVKVGARVLVEVNPPACGVGALIEFGYVAGATSYTVSYKDNGKPVTTTVPASSPDLRKGSSPNRLGLAGYTASACDNLRDVVAGYVSRFRDPRVVATLPGKPTRYAIQGRVWRAAKPGEPGESISLEGKVSIKGVPGVAVTVGSQRTRTDERGYYLVVVPSGSYPVSAGPRYCVRGVEPCRHSRIVVAPPGGGPDFRGMTPDETVVPVPVPDTTDPGPQGIATVVAIRRVSGGRIGALLVRDGRSKPLGVGQNIRPRDRIRTNGHTTVEIELGLGGRIEARPDSDITVSGDREWSSNKPRSFSLTKGGMWAKCGEMKESLQIQVTGGVMGIKG